MPIINTVTMSYCSPHHNESIDLINNPNPKMKTKQTHILFLPELCPASHNPKPNSELHISYRARDKFLELFSLERYIRAFIGHMQVRDIEYFTQEVAKDCANALEIKVKVKSVILLEGLQQKQIVTTTARPGK